MAAVDTPLTGFQTVQTWAAGLQKQWGGDPLAEEPEKLAALAAFCTFVGEDPDSIVRRCFRIRKADGERVISSKWRAHYAERIKEFRAQDARNGRRSAAAVLGFLIHNGVLIQV